MPSKQSLLTPGPAMTANMPVTMVLMSLMSILVLLSLASPTHADSTNRKHASELAGLDAHNAQLFDKVVGYTRLRSYKDQGVAQLMREKGAFHYDAFETFDDQGYRGLRATRDIAKGELLTSVLLQDIPLTASRIPHILRGELKGRGAEQMIRESSLDGSFSFLMAALLARYIDYPASLAPSSTHLVVRKRSFTEWNPRMSAEEFSILKTYLESLPPLHSFRNMIHFHAKDQKIQEVLMGSELELYVRDKVNQHHQVFSRLKTAAPDTYRTLTREQFEMTYLAITTRIFNVKDYHSALIPIGDLFNHATPHRVNIHWTTKDISRYVLRAYNAISAQENGVLDLLQPTDSAPESMEGRGAFTFRDWQHPYYMMLARELQLQDLQDRKGGSSRSSSRLREGEESVILERSLLRGRARLDRALIAHQYYAHRLIKKGEELLTAYGRKSNSELIDNYGFTMENDPDVRLERSWLVTLEQDASEGSGGGSGGGRGRSFALREKKRRFLTETLGWDEDPRILDVAVSDVSHGHCVSGLLTYYRIKYMTPEELALSQGLKTTSRTHRAMLPAVTCRNELAVLRELAVSSKESLSEYPAPEEEDAEFLSLESNLAACPPFSLQRMVRVAVRDEKLYFSFFVDLHRRMKPVLQACQAGRGDLSAVQERMQAVLDKDIRQLTNQIAAQETGEEKTPAGVIPEALLYARKRGLARLEGYGQYLQHDLNGLIKQHTEGASYEGQDRWRGGWQQWRERAGTR